MASFSAILFHIQTVCRQQINLKVLLPTYIFYEHFRQETDWGLRQIDATKDVTNKGNSFFLVATSFGHHTLHHLFPTVDHSKLHLLYPILEETCFEFGIKYETKPQWDMLKGMHQQLIRNQGKENYAR